MPLVLVLLGIGAVVAVAVIATAGGSGTAGPDGVVRADPKLLAQKSGAGIDVYALARMISSEAGGASEQAKIAIAWTAVNEARRRKVTISGLLLAGHTRKGAPSSSAGFFGAQKTGKYATTAHEATAVDLAIARKVYGGVVADPTGGATQFDSPRSQIVGVAGNTKTAAQVAAERSAHSDLVVASGVDPNVFRFWRPRSA
ncbi:MAG: hypothetical protein PHR30_18505 [Gallionellaceae bacterium]|nr:hypothetical protein [Gallionellaceae bacterium]